MCCRLDCDPFGHLKCKHCNSQCNNQTCLRMHEEKFCYKISYCYDCGNRKFRNHVCGSEQRWCHNCCKSVKFSHKCYIQKQLGKPNKSEKGSKVPMFDGIITFDYECYQDQVHIPNLVIAEKMCSECLETDDRCASCGIFKFDNNDDFGDWLFSLEKYVAIAHNLRGYDGCFILQYINKHIMPGDGAPKVIANGSSLLSISFRKVKLIDSLSFFPTSLENLAKMFDIQELKKGFFPHNFNKPENFSYVGPYPCKEAYGYKFFSETKKNAFDTWYESKANEIFDFKQELHDYCLSDVKLLSAAVLAFRKIILNISKDDSGVGIDPWLTSITMPSLCLKIFRRNMMPAETIAVIPEYGYNPTHKTSIKCQQWIKYLSRTLQVSFIWFELLFCL